MKVRRYKRAQHILSIFRYNFGFEPPFRVLLDGTFAMAALQNKINLREQMPKYLCEEVELCVTRCILDEVEKLGRDLYGALCICRQFQVEPCPHKPLRTASACIQHMARRMKEKTKYFIATQDFSLTDALRKIPGVPILFIKFKGILIEKPSEATMQEIDSPKDNLSALKALKKEVLGEQEPRKKKRKRVKGPNPLSVKKKKKSVAPVKRIGAQSGTRTAAGKRRRRKKQLIGADGSAIIPASPGEVT